MQATLSTAAYFGYFAGFVTGVIFGAWAYKTLNPDLISEAVELLDSCGNLSGVWMLPRDEKLPVVYCGYVPPYPVPSPGGLQPHPDYSKPPAPPAPPPKRP